MDFSHLRSALDEKLNIGTAGFRPRRGNELHFPVDRFAVPELAELLRSHFGAELILLVAQEAVPDGTGFELHYLFANARENWFVHATAGLPPNDPTVPSLATFSFPASRFEREIRDLFGIEATGHPDRRALVRHAFWPKEYHPLRRGSVLPGTFEDDGTPFPFLPVGGEGVYEIPVGPVHAGIIEPGHFRISAVGETVIDLKIRLYFTHKGTEKLFEGRTPAEGVKLAERISGDTTVGHSMAYCQALEALAGVEIPPVARYLRVILLEMERLYNHVADFGMICNDTGFALAHSHCFRIRERLLRLNQRLTGNRLLRDGVVPGGAGRPLPGDLDLARELDSILSDFNEVVEFSLDNTMVMDRLVGTGGLTAKIAGDLGLLGYVARASGINVDARRDHPFAAYGDLKFKVPVLETGDVFARTMLRVEEVRQSVELIKQALAGAAGGPLTVPVGDLAAFEPAFGLVEGWRGAIVHWVMVDREKKLFRVKVKDPSFANWPALSLALLENIVPDFPLCNKSFNQSYSGNDL